MANCQFICYHGTDKNIADNIIKDKFIVKTNDEHWLGNGVYFYEDKSLAEWWTNRPTHKFGSEIKTPAILQCKINVSENRVLNLCSLDGYKKYASLFNNFFKENIYYKHRPDEELKISKIRSLFFNYLFLLDDIDLIVAPFVIPTQPYLPIIEKDLIAKKMNITYTEIQICLNSEKQNLIIEKNIL